MTRFNFSLFLAVLIFLTACGGGGGGGGGNAGGGGPVVVDTTPPSITAPNSVSFTLTGFANVTITVTDNADGSISFTVTCPNEVGFVSGTFTATATGDFVCQVSATDSAGNQANASIQIDVNPDPNSAPNILLIIADDMGAEASSLYPALSGSSGQVAMPNLEQLASQGIVFENAWANPACSPTRGNIVSGEYGHQTGVTEVGGDLDPISTTSIFQRVQSSSAQYSSAVFGKWHLGNNVADHGITKFKGFLGGGIPDYFDWSWEDVDGNSTSTNDYSTSLLTDFAIDFIAQQPATTPWFVYLSYNAPHTAGSDFQAPPGNLHSVNLGTLQPGDRGTTVVLYQATIQAMDSEIGRLINAIGSLDNTVVIFIGDNGTPNRGQYNDVGVRGNKGSVYEGGVRVPLVVAGGHVGRNGERDSSLIQATDLYATISQLSGATLGALENSFSAVELLDDANASSGREFAFTEICGGNGRYAARDQRYKLLYDDGSWELYDLETDAEEVTNLFGDPGFASQQQDLQGFLDDLAANAVQGCFN